MSTQSDAERVSARGRGDAREIVQSAVDRLVERANRELKIARHTMDEFREGGGDLDDALGSTLRENRIYWQAWLNEAIEISEALMQRDGESF